MEQSLNYSWSFIKVVKEKGNKLVVVLDSKENAVFDENIQEIHRFSGKTTDVPVIKLWDLDSPVLYTLHTYVTLNGDKEVLINVI